jgi:DNA invertase Pin-like site-specific DNA recombinase
LYERRSTNEELQADSLDIQDEQLRANARQNGDEVVRVYRDDRSGRTADREGFRRLIHDVTYGPDFDVILVLDVTRWGRFENVDESA